MSRVTSTARSVLQDLVERRLWPVALLLVGAVLAVPVLMGGGGGDAAQAPTAPSGSAAKAALASDEGAQVTIVESTPPSRKRTGHARNPFVQPAAALSAASTPSASTSETASAPSGGQATSSPSAAGASLGSVPTTLSQGADKGATGAGGVVSQPTTDVETTPATTKRPSEHQDPRDDVFRIDLRYGSGPGEMHAAKDVARLTALPSADDPVFVFLGVMQDAKTVVLLLPSGASGEGEATCRPKAGDCRLLEVRKGETEVIDVPTADGGERQFVVRVTGVKRSDAKSDARATEAHQRASKAGQDLLREAAEADGTDAFDAYRYRPELGTLARAAHKAHAAGAGTRTVTRPGEVVVWRTRPAQKH